MLSKFQPSVFRRAGSIIFAMALLVSVTGSPVAAQDFPQTEYEPPSYLVTISLPDLGNLDIPRFTDKEEAKNFSAGLIMHQVGQTMAELRRLQEAGLVQNVELVNDGTAIRIQGVEEMAFPIIEGLDTVEAIMDETDETLACVQSSAEVLPKLIWEISHTQPAKEIPLEGASLDGIASIEIYPPNYDSDYWRIVTTTSPKIEVKLEIWRNGALVAYDYQFSDPDGSVSFYPTYYSCPSDHYAWMLISGDTVKIIAGGQTRQTTYAPVTGWANPDTDMVFGTTLPGRSVQVILSEINDTKPCEWVDYTKQSISDASGNFSINLASTVNFKGNAYGYIKSIDSGGNFVYSNVEIYDFNVWEDWDYFFLRHQPYQYFTATLKRGSEVISTQSGTTNENGWGFGYFSENAVPGDIATLTVGADTFIRTVIDTHPLQITSFDPATGILTGSGQPGQKITVNYYKRYSTVVFTYCDSGSCQYQTINSSGNFTFNIGPVDRSYDVYLSHIDEEDKTWVQTNYTVYSEPAISAYPEWDEVYFNFNNYYSSTPSVILKTSDGVVKETVSAQFYSRYRGDYNAQFTKDMIAGDKVEITDGSRTDTMTVGDLRDLRLNYNTDQLTGKGTGRQIIAEVSGGYGEYYNYCVIHNLGSTTEFALNIPEVKGDYRAGIYLVGSDGHFTSSSTNSLDLNVWVNSESLRGWTETPGTTVYWELWRGGTKVDSGADSSDPGNTYFYTWYNIVPKTGDELRVTTSDGNSAKIIYPDITAQADFNTRTVSGKALAGRWGSTNFYRHTPDNYHTFRLYWYPDSSNNYLAHMPQEMYWYQDCSPVTVGLPCNPLGASTWTADNFWTIFWPGSPPDNPIPADDYEVDNSKETASNIEMIQSHTLHKYNDEDWIKIPVTQEDVSNNHVFWLETFSLGLDFDLNMELLAPDGITKIAEASAENWDGSGEGPEIQYIFESPGTYYLRLHSMGYDWDGGYCDSKYKILVMVDPKFIYLPIIMR